MPIALAPRWPKPIGTNIWSACHAADPQLEANPNHTSAFVEMRERWIADLENVVRWQPSHAWAHLKLAETHRLQFEQLQMTSENPCL